MVRLYPLVCFLLLGSCSLTRTPLLEDGGADVPGLDAPLPDVPGLDAPPMDVPPPPDVPGLDAPAMLDVPVIPDDVPVDTGGACIGSGAETCNRLDDDCDGTVDEAVCGTCTALTVAGRGYLSCPGPVTGVAAWAGACRTAAPGYDLVVFDDPVEQDRVRAALSARSISDPHWVGLNDFDTSGTYVWRDRTSSYRPPVPGTDSAKRFVVFRVDGTYEELTGTDTRRFLCEAVAPASACGGTESSCNGVDEDCDGDVDEGQSCGHACTTTTFWDSVYYTCSAGSWMSGDRCRTAMSATLATVNNGTENGVLDDAVSPEVWIGLMQAMSSATPAAGWGWTAPGSVAVSYGAPPTTPPWRSSQPNDNGEGEDNEENCASMRTDGEFEDNSCGDSLAILCERSWSY